MNKMMKSLVSFVIAALLSVGASFAENGGWQVAESSGTVRMSQAMAGIQLVSTGELLSSGSVLTTGIDGHAVLVRGDQQIIVGPNSRMSLPVAEEKGMTKIVQDLGTLLFKVDKKDRQHFRVETPIIAAVVKGTTFTVTAGASGHSVHVAEGAVEVSALSGGASQMVTAGMTAMVSKANPRAIDINSGADKSRDAENNLEGKEASNLVVPTEIGADQLDYSNLSGGLVQPSENASTRVSTNATMGNDVSSAVRGQGGGATVVEQIRMNTVGDNGTPNRGVGNAFGTDNANANAGAGNNNANAGAGNNNGNANAGAGADNGNANANAGPGNNNANANAGAGNNNGNVNAGANNGNGNAGVNVGVEVGGAEVGVGLGQGGVNVGLGLGGPNSGKPKN